jgi:hypothetical protein
MFTSLELRRAKNGYVVTVNREDDSEEYIFDTLRKTMKFLKELAEGKVQSE